MSIFQLSRPSQDNFYSAAMVADAHAYLFSLRNVTACMHDDQQLCTGSLYHFVFQGPRKPSDPPRPVEPPATPVPPHNPPGPDQPPASPPQDPPKPGEPPAAPPQDPTRPQQPEEIPPTEPSGPDGTDPPLPGQPQEPGQPTPVPANEPANEELPASTPPGIGKKNRREKLHCSPMLRAYSEIYKRPLSLVTLSH